MRDDRFSREEVEEILERRSKREFRGKVKRKAIIAGIVLALILGFYICWKLTHDDGPKITSNYIHSKLEDSSELTTQKMEYQGMIHYEEGSIPFITKKEYSMTYKATIDAGVDLSQVRVDDLGDGKFNVILPEVEIQGVHVDPDSIEFYDESHAIFNWNTKRDGVKAVELAEEDAVNNADIEALKKEARDSAKQQINQLLEEAIKSGKVTVE